MNTQVKPNKATQIAILADDYRGYMREGSTAYQNEKNEHARFYFDEAGKKLEELRKLKVNIDEFLNR